MLPTTLEIGFVHLDAIGAATFFAVLLNLAIVVAKRFSPFADRSAVSEEARAATAEPAVRG